MPTCKNCHKELIRKQYLPGGRWEENLNFSRRVYCHRRCMAEAFEGRIKVMNDKNSRRQSAKTRLEKCQICGRSGHHVHHKDENPQNNNPSNLMTLCGSCHRHCHSPNFTETGEQRVSCKHCAKQSVKAGLCNTHLTRRLKYGDPLITKKKVGSLWVLTRDVG